MDPITDLALDALDDAFVQLIPNPAPANLSREITIRPMRVRAGSIGGYAGSNAQPPGSRYLRRIRAAAEVLVKGGQDSAARDHLNEVVRALLSEDRRQLRRSGIYRLELDEAAATDRTARFEVDYEYQHTPTVSEDVIGSLSLAIDLNTTPYRPRYRCDIDTSTLAAEAAPLGQFLVADDPDVDPGSPASAWAFHATSKSIRQSAATAGGPPDLSATKKAGAQLLWRPDTQTLSLSRFVVSTQFESADPAGIGLVFCRQSSDDFWYLLCSELHQYHIVGRKSAGTYSVVGVVNGVGFSQSTRHTLTVYGFDRTLMVELDGVRTLRATTPEALPAGQVGFLTHGNAQAHFFRARLLELV